MIGESKTSRTSLFCVLGSVPSAGGPLDTNAGAAGPVTARVADTALTSFTNFAQLETLEQVDLSTLTMTPAQEALAAACAGACLMCGRCANSCPAGVPVSDVMRIASYPDRPGWREFAADEFADLGVDSGRIAAACAGCTVCRGACPARHADADAVRQTVQRIGQAVA